MFLFEEKIYSIKEKRFVDIWVTILIQQGGESSLLKRGIYFNVSPITSKPAITIRTSQLEGTKHKYIPNIREKYKIIPTFVNHGFTNIWDAFVCVTAYNVYKGQIDTERRNRVLTYLHFAQEIIINLDPFSNRDDSLWFNDYVGNFFPNVIKIAKQYIAAFIMDGEDWDPSYMELKI